MSHFKFIHKKKQTNERMWPSPVMRSRSESFACRSDQISSSRVETLTSLDKCMHLSPIKDDILPKYFI